MLQIDNKDFQAELAREKERILFLQAPVANFTMLAMVVIFFLVMQGRAVQGQLMLWSAAVTLFVTFRLYIWRLHTTQPQRFQTGQWIQIYTVFTGLLGAVFALCFLFGYGNADGIVSFVLTFTLFSMITAAGYVLTCHLPIFYIYTYPQVIVYGLVLLSQGNIAHALLSVAVVIYLIMLTAFSRNAHKQFVNTMMLQFEKRTLIDQLNQEVTQREDIIRRRTSELVKSNLDLERKEKLLKRNERSLHFLAHHDTLTGLPNRLLLVDRLYQSIKKAERASNGLALLFIDLDYFKEINDSLGHSVGDELLRVVAETLTDSIRREDTAARLGGDEFTIILEDLEDEEYVPRVAEKILKKFGQPLRLKKHELTITASIGISLYPQHGTDTETLLRNADTAMYQTKNEGRNSYSIYSKDLTARAVNRLELETALRKALARDELLLHYQPQIDLHSGRMVGVEALIRWMHPEHGLIFPDRFISLAEETGLIDEIGLWVLHHGCERMVEWRKMGHNDFSLAVNISGRQLQDEGLSRKIAEVLDKTGCQAGVIELEITEGYLIQQPEKTAQHIDDLRRIGVQIAIDDFGTGYSSLTHLKAFPISKLKIDASFVRDILTDSNDQAITSAIIAMSKSLGLRVIAEGVENQQQVEFLIKQGCHEAQGFLISRPVPEGDLLAFIEASNQT